MWSQEPCGTFVVELVYALSLSILFWLQMYHMVFDCHWTFCLVFRSNQQLNGGLLSLLNILTNLSISDHEPIPIATAASPSTHKCNAARWTNLNVRCSCNPCRLSRDSSWNQNTAGNRKLKVYPKVAPTSPRMTTNDTLFKRNNHDNDEQPTIWRSWTHHPDLVSNWPK